MIFPAVSSSPGHPAPSEPPGITAALFTKLDDRWQRHSTAIGAPIEARSSRKALTTDLPGKFSAVEEHFSERKDLVIQFGTTEAGKGFIDARFTARHVAPLGRQAENCHPARHAKSLNAQLPESYKTSVSHRRNQRYFSI